METSLDFLSESGETHDDIPANTALAAGLPNVSRLTQEKITGGSGCGYLDLDFDLGLVLGAAGWLGALAWPVS